MDIFCEGFENESRIAFQTIHFNYISEYYLQIEC